MGIRTYRPTTPTRRWTTDVTCDDLTQRRPEKALTEPMKKSGGRNNHGHMTIRHRGGGHKRLYRRIDFVRRDKEGMPARVISLEYDPNRSARISLVQYEDGEKRYILAPDGLRVGSHVLTSGQAEIQPGNCLPLRNIPPGITIHNLELVPRQGSKIVRSAGSSAVIQAKEGNYAHVKLPSSEIRIFHMDCLATIGQVSNVEHNTRSLGKAGRTRWRGFRPRVRGVAMNPVDHPHGGGEGKAGQGNPHPVSPWGQHTKGLKTRARRKLSDRWIVRRRIVKRKGK